MSDFTYVKQKLEITNSEYEVDIEEDIVHTFMTNLVKKFKLPRGYEFRSIVIITYERMNKVEYYLFNKRHKLNKCVIVHGKMPPQVIDMSRRGFMLRYQTWYC